jgi:aspartyl-tRNA(Asn)/glutamyl-tRNA(Gln) amidotransferase subunit A
VDDYVSACDQGVKGMKIGVLPRIFDMNVAPSILNALKANIENLKNEGAEIVEIDLPHMDYSLPVYRVVAFAEAASSLARYDGIRYGERVDGADFNEIYVNTRNANFGKEVRRRILVGNYVLSSENYDIYYSKAVKVRSIIMSEFQNIFTKVDTILMPTTAGPAPSFSAVSDPEKMYLEDFFTLPVNIACIGGISTPVGMDNGLPIGLQVVHNSFDEVSALRVSSAIEKFAQFRGFAGLSSASV